MTEQAQEARNARAVRVGEVVSAKMEKTLVVQITRKVPHPVYTRHIKKSIKLHVHDEDNNAGVGDTVKVMATRPMSKTKRWRLVEILERAK